MYLNIVKNMFRRRKELPEKLVIKRCYKPVWSGITAAAKRTGYSRTQIMRHLTGEFRSVNVARKLKECNIEVQP